MLNSKNGNFYVVVTGIEVLALIENRRKRCSTEELNTLLRYYI